MATRATAEPSSSNAFVALEGRWSFLAKAGAWYWITIAIGIALRAFFVTSTMGTTDVEIWTQHAQGVAERGLIGHYHFDPSFNHPPVISWIMASLWRFAQSSGIPFRVVFRSLIASADLASAFALLKILHATRWRFVASAFYSIAPIALALGAYHGNTDAVIGLCLLLSVLYASRNRPVLAGLLLGASLWIKLSGVFAAPAIGFAFPKWRDRIVVALTTIVVGFSTFVPALVADHQIVLQNVFAYRGIVIFTLPTPGVPVTFVWGLKNTFIQLWGYDPRVDLWAQEVRGQAETWPAACVSIVNSGSNWALVVAFVFAFLRRRANDAAGLASTVAGCFAIFYAFVDAWSFQYFAWSMPFWLCAGPLFALAANAFAGGYIYLLYAFVCDDFLLRPVWNFNGHPRWPSYLPAFRELAQWTFVTFSAAWLVRAIVAECRAWSRRSS